MDVTGASGRPTRSETTPPASAIDEDARHVVLRGQGVPHIHIRVQPTAGDHRQLPGGGSEATDIPGRTKQPVEPRHVPVVRKEEIDADDRILDPLHRGRPHGDAIAPRTVSLDRLQDGPAEDPTDQGMGNGVGVRNLIPRQCGQRDRGALVAAREVLRAVHGVHDQRPRRPPGPRAHLAPLLGEDPDRLGDRLPAPLDDPRLRQEIELLGHVALGVHLDDIESAEALAYQEASDILEHIPEVPLHVLHGGDRLPARAEGP